MGTTGNDAPPFRVLFVCTANQARSPMAEAIARHEVTLGLAAPLQFSSAGSHARPGRPATPETLLTIKELGLDLGRHRSRELTRPRINAAGLVLVMERSHIKFVRAVAPEAADRTFTLMQFWRVAAGESAESPGALVELALETAEHTRKDDIIDPLGHGVDAFRACAARLRLLIRPVVGALAAAAWREAATRHRRLAPSTPPRGTRPRPEVAGDTGERSGERPAAQESAAESDPGTRPGKTPPAARAASAWETAGVSEGPTGPTTGETRARQERLADRAMSAARALSAARERAERERPPPDGDGPETAG